MLITLNVLERASLWDTFIDFKSIINQINAFLEKSLACFLFFLLDVDLPSGQWRVMDGQCVIIDRTSKQ